MRYERIVKFLSGLNTLLDCLDGDIRLVDGEEGPDSSIIAGRVESCSLGVWNTACDDLWAEAEAQVVCAQLGFDDPGVLVCFEHSYTSR